MKIIFISTVSVHKLCMFTTFSICYKDIRNQRRYRNNRKQELNRLRQTLKALTNKREFYESQVDYYNQYVKTCNENMQSKVRYGVTFILTERMKRLYSH